MGSRVIGASCLFALLLVIPGIAMGSYDYELGDWGQLNLKGDITYGVKVRTERPKEAWVNNSQGNRNFDIGDVTNNNIIGTAEVNLDAKHFTFYGRLVGRLDWAYMDPDTYSSGTRAHAAYNLQDASEFFVEGRFGRFTTRWGRHVVQWGENFAGVFTGVNEISPMALGLLDTAGNPPRSSQVPTFIAWNSFRITNDISLEAVWQPDFDPRYWFPVVGTFASTSDLLGFGAITNFDIELAPGFYQNVRVDDQRPEDFGDKQQYGGALRMVLPQLNLLEIGFYYYHYRSRTPLATMELSEGMGLPETLVFQWPELDMFGMSFSQAIQTVFGRNFDWTISGELVWRPNDPLQRQGSAGYQRQNSLAWNIQFWKMIPNLMPFTPYNVTLNQMIEFNGKSILEYDEEELTDPWLTGNYWVMSDLSIDGVIDNVKLNFTLMARGGMQKENGGNDVHSFGFTLGGKYGTTWGMKFGYTLRYANENTDPTGSKSGDRDAFNWSVTYYW